MLFRTIIVTVLTAITIYFFKPFESALLNLNFSWTFSKALPYLLLIVEGVLLSYYTGKILKIRLKIILQILMLVLPFVIAFALNPIYQGDFSKNGSLPKIKELPIDFKNVDLVVVTIPGCPFCHESAYNSNLMLKRNPKLKIRYIVCNTNLQELKPYREKLDSKIEVVLASDPTLLSQIAEGSFPSFFYLKTNKVIEKWSNDQFGVRAKDLVED